MENKLKQNLEQVFSTIENGNNLGEPITLVGATKTMDVDTINEAISYGLKVVAENRVQEFNQKYNLIVGATHHFIGHLQTNKVKYLVGKVDLIHSVDSINLATAINDCAKKRGVIQDVLVEVNVGGELSKSGFSFDNALDGVYQIVNTLDSVCVRGLMAMLPLTEDKALLEDLCKKMRALYERIKAENDNFCYLSMGMSNDYPIAIKNGSNMIRLGSSIFGARRV